MLATEPHPEHMAMVGVDVVTWPNESYEPPPPRPGTTRRRDLIDMTRRAAPDSRVRNRIPLDPAEQARRAADAHGAMESEFVEAAIQGGILLSRRCRRWTADDLWEWLDDHGHVTAHPKGMRGILTRLIKDKVIAAVPDEDPDSHRQPRNSNRSRMLRVYESRIYEPTADRDAVLANFD
jgi:hypothetical protein